MKQPPNIPQMKEIMGLKINYREEKKMLKVADKMDKKKCANVVKNFSEIF